MGTDLPEFSPDRSAPKEIDLYYYNFNIGDYRRDTVHLSILEHGIYRQLIDTYYLNEGPFEADLDALMRTHCVRNADEMQAFKNVLKDFFDEVDGRYVHKGCERVLAQYHAKSDKAKASARARWDRPDANALPTQSKRNANGMLTNNHKPITNNQEPITINQEPIEPTDSTLPKVKVPYAEIIQLFKSLLPELPEPKVLTDKRKRTIASMWIWVLTSKDEDGDRRATNEHEGLEYFRRFFTYARKNDFVMGKTGRTGSHANWQADIDYLCSERGRQQVIERTSS